MQIIKQTIITIIICAAVMAGVSLVSAWTGPPYGGVCNDPPCPPGGNVPAPINVSSVSQNFSGNKTLNLPGAANNLIIGNGSLGVSNNLSVGGIASVGGFRMTAGAANGRVLTSDDSGLASWQIGGGASGVSQIIAGTNITISPAGGTGAVTVNSTGGAGGYWTLSGTNIYNSNTGNVGIGTASPSGNARVTISSPNFSTAALYWGVGGSPIGFLGVRDGNTALIGTYASANDLIFRAGDADRMIIKNDNSIGWYNISNTQVGFLGYNGNDALVGATSVAGGGPGSSLRLRAGDADRMIIYNTGGINLMGNIMTNGYIQGGLYGRCVMVSGSCSGYASQVIAPAYCSEICYCPSGFTRMLTGKAASDTEFYYTCVRN